jgi:metal-responsive CopG/Arc/MetJ family transcriptional regulator
VTREHLSITLPKECLEWLDERVSVRRYFSRSDAIEVLILNAMKEEPSLSIRAERARKLHQKEKKR